MSDIITKPLNVPPTPPEPYGDMFVTFTAQEANSTIGLSRLSTNQTLEYSTDNINWLTFNTSVTITLTNVGDKVYIRGVLSANNTASDYTQFTMTGRITASGNCNTLWNYEDLNAPLKDFCGYRMFQDCSSLTTAPDLPLTTLANNCYASMFSHCTSLTTTPELPATILVSYCYASMFSHCTSLTTTPDLPSTTLADSCYRAMFQGCTSLTTAPKLPATTLAYSCYISMFQDCTSLTTAPELPAITLADSCYAGMFSTCRSLTNAPELPATTLTGWCYANMFQGCTSLTTAPELPATTLADLCYGAMFQDCTSLNYIKCLATNISANSCTQYWVNGVASTGVFVKHPDISESTWGSGVNGIPTGWTVIEETEPVTPEDIANEIMQEVDIFAVPFNDLYETCLSVYLDMGYNIGDFDEVYAIIQSTPNLHDDVETFVVSNDSNEKVITVDNNGDFYLKGVGGYDGKNTKVEDSNIKPLQDVINEKQEALVAGNNIQINDNTISATDTTYTASDFDIKDLTDSTGLRSKWDNKQNALTAGNNIDITNNVITSKGYTYNNGTITADGSVQLQNNLDIVATTDGTPTIKLQRGSADDSFTDFMICGQTGNLKIDKSTSGTQTNLFNLSEYGDVTFTGKITATNATSHNLVYGRNELNLADLTNGNTLYFNYRNSTNAINEYRFCKGVGNQNTYSDIRCGTLYQTSDITKKNIISDLDLDKAYNLIDKCQTIIYTLKDDERNKEQVGVIAQEIQDFFPEVVSADENGILAIDYSRLTVVIMKVLKDVIKRVQRLEEKE